MRIILTIQINSITYTIIATSDSFIGVDKLYKHNRSHWIKIIITNNYNDMQAKETVALNLLTFTCIKII